MEAIYFIIGISVGGWLLVSPLLFFYWHYNREARVRHKKYEKVVLFGTIVAITGLVAEGVDVLLFSNESGVGYILGFVVAIAILRVMSDKESLEDENKAIRRELATRRQEDRKGSADK